MGDTSGLAFRFYSHLLFCAGMVKELVMGIRRKSPIHAICRSFLLGVICLGFLPLTASISQAAQNEALPNRPANTLNFCEGKTGVDLLIVTDQSGSMSYPINNRTEVTFFDVVNQALRSMSSQLGLSGNVHVALMGFGSKFLRI